EIPTTADLKAGWTRWVPQIAALAHRYHRVVLFGEIGYVATTYVGRRPWQGHTYRSSPTLQARAYHALLATFQSKSWWKGALWFCWNSRLADRTPKDRFTERFLKLWYTGRTT